MKKALSLILALVLCLGLCACGGNTQDPHSGSTNSNNTNNTENEALVLYDAQEGYSFINHAKIKELIEEIELTAENWTDYIDVYSYTETKVQQDTFGEIASTQTTTYYALGAKSEKYFYFREFAIELKDTSTGELTVYQGNPNEPLLVTEDFRLEQYECTRIKGAICLVDVPEEAIRQNTDGTRGFIVRYCDISYGPPWRFSLTGADGREIRGAIDIVFF